MAHLRVLFDGRVFVNIPTPRTGSHNLRNDPAFVEPKDKSIDLGRRGPMELEIESDGSRGAVKLVCGRCHCSRTVKLSHLEREARNAARQGLIKITLTAGGQFEPVVDVNQWRRSHPKSD